MKQRFNPLKFAGLTAFILLITFSWSTPAPVFLFALPALFFALFLFRLYDDLMQAPHDQGKPNRAYTETGNRKTLFVYLLVMGILYVLSLFLFSISTGTRLVLFILLNHLLYILWVQHKTIAAFLPLLKYPVLSILLLDPDFSGEIDPGILIYPLILLFSMLAYESMEDENFPAGVKLSYVFQLISFLLFLSITTHIVALSLCGASLLLSFYFTSKRLKAAPYIFLFLLLCSKLFIDNYVI